VNDYIPLPDRVADLLSINVRAFETMGAAVGEDELRLKRLKKAWTRGGISSPLIDRAHAENLALRLEESLEFGIPTWTLASSVAFRSMRAAIFGQMFEALSVYHDADLCMFTILKKSWVFSPEEFNETVAIKIKREFENDLRRSGAFDNGDPFIAFLDGEFEPSSSKFILHFHGITTVRKARLLPNLKKRKGYDLTSTGAPPIRCDPVRDRIREFTYCLMSYWVAKTVFAGHRNGSEHRIPEPYHSLYLLWLDKQRLLDLTVTNACWSKRAGGSEAMRKLQLIISRWN